MCYAFSILYLSLRVLCVSDLCIKAGVGFSIMKYEFGYCKNELCGKWQIIVNRRHGLCQKCNQIRLASNKEKKGTEGPRIEYTGKKNPTFNYCTKWGFKNELQLFNFKWNNEIRISYISGRPIPYFAPMFFLHVIPKALNKFPHYKLNPENVVFGLLIEHDLWDKGTEDERMLYLEKYPQASWDGMIKKKLKLMESYRIEFP